MYVIFDFETTGLDYEKEQVIEVGAIKLDKHYKEVDGFHTMVKLNEGKELPDIITKITGHTEADLADGMTEDEALSKLADFIDDNVVVAQYASFDLGFLKDHKKPERFLCTRSMSKALGDGKNSLKDLVPRYGSNVENDHTALNDCRATAEVFKAMMARIAMVAMATDNDVTAINMLAESAERPLKYIPDNAIVVNTDELEQDESMTHL